MLIACYNSTLSHAIKIVSNQHRFGFLLQAVELLRYERPGSYLLRQSKNIQHKGTFTISVIKWVGLLLTVSQCIDTSLHSLALFAQVYQQPIIILHNITIHSNTNYVGIGKYNNQPLLAGLATSITSTIYALLCTLIQAYLILIRPTNTLYYTVGCVVYNEVVFYPMKVL